MTATPLRILLVEDNPGDVRLIEELLREARPFRHLLRAVGSLRNALECLGEPVDLVLLDLGLPDAAGLEGLKRLRERFSNLPVVVLTGLRDEEVGFAAVQAGAQDFLVKEEASPQLLARAIRYAIERQRMENQTRYAQKMEILANLTAGVAHEFNNILTSIVGFASLLQLRLPERPEEQLPVRRILDSADRGARLTAALLDFSRDQPGCVRRLDLCSVLSRIARLLPPLLVPAIAFELTLPEKPLEVQADSAQLEQSLVKLVTNARQSLAGAGGGRVKLELAPDVIGPAFRTEHGFGRPGAYARISLTDDGPGMASTIAARIFEPFFSARDGGEGRGLGLAIVYGIVKQHRGYILCRTAPGAGTRFDIYLPRAPGPGGDEGAGN